METPASKTHTPLSKITNVNVFGIVWGYHLSSQLTPDLKISYYATWLLSSLCFMLSETKGIEHFLWSAAVRDGSYKEADLQNCALIN